MEERLWLAVNNGEGGKWLFATQDMEGGCNWQRIKEGEEVDVSYDRVG
jgi:hypothetical protein